MVIFGSIQKLLFGVGPEFDTEIRDNKPYKIAETFLRYIPIPRHHILRCKKSENINLDFFLYTMPISDIVWDPTDKILKNEHLTLSLNSI